MEPLQIGHIPRVIPEDFRNDPAFGASRDPDGVVHDERREATRARGVPARLHPLVARDGEEFHLNNVLDIVLRHEVIVNFGLRVGAIIAVRLIFGFGRRKDRGSLRRGTPHQTGILRRCVLDKPTLTLGFNLLLELLRELAVLETFGHGNNPAAGTGPHGDGSVVHVRLLWFVNRELLLQFGGNFIDLIHGGLLLRVFDGIFDGLLGVVHGLLGGIFQGTLGFFLVIININAPGHGLGLIGSGRVIIGGLVVGGPNDDGGSNSCDFGHGGDLLLVHIGEGLGGVGGDGSFVGGLLGVLEAARHVLHALLGGQGPAGDVGSGIGGSRRALGLRGRLAAGGVLLESRGDVRDARFADDVVGGAVDGVHGNAFGDLSLGHHGLVRIGVAIVLLLGRSRSGGRGGGGRGLLFVGAGGGCGDGGGTSGGAGDGGANGLGTCIRAA
mmetsp:Transcript_21189/g.56610  ORF Transcript_21189/g.56610 Transcript_21189/m.56610 type:complete len:440 (-) Transcript_21189:292-1611(-)